MPTTADAPDVEQLIADHLRLARRLAYAQASRVGQRPDDYYQDACVGLIKAARDWQQDTGVPFGAYAQLRIRGEMLDGLRRMDVVKRRRHHDPAATYLTPGPSLDQPAWEDGPTLANIIPAQAVSPEDTAVDHDLARWALKQMTDRERNIFIAYYWHGRKMRDIAAELGITESRVSQLMKQVTVRVAQAA